MARGRKPELQPDAGAITATIRPPSWLSTDGKAEWRRVIPILNERKILTDADLGSLESYCVATSRVREIERLFKATRNRKMEAMKRQNVPPHLRSLAVTMINTAIDPKLFRMQDQAIKTARQLAAELGLTPVSRSRPSIREDNAPDDDSPLAL